MEGAGAATSCRVGVGLTAGAFFDFPGAAGSEGRAGTCTLPHPYLEERAPKIASGSYCSSFFVEL